jgi:hypothetical protein
VKSSGTDIHATIMMQKENSWVEYFLEARSILAYLGQIGILESTIPKGLSLVGSRVHK